MRMLGNTCLALAIVIYLFVLPMLRDDLVRRRADAGTLWGVLFSLAPLGLLLTVALLALVAAGGLDWIPLARGLLFPLALAAGVVVTVASFFSFLGYAESPGQLPRVMRPFLHWMAWLFPACLMLFLLLALNPHLAPGLPPMAVRLPFAVASGVSALLCAALLLEWGWRSQQAQVARLAERQRDHDHRDARILSEVQAMDPTRDFASLLGFANRFENSQIREAAIEKARSRPDFHSALAEVMQTWRADSALVYLDACDLPEAEMRALADPFRAAVKELTRQAQDAVERTHTLHADQFDWNTRLILSVADKLAALGADCRQEVTGFRKVFEARRAQEAHLRAPQTLDAWLARRPTAARQETQAAGARGPGTSL